jgi:hypothetical protein
MSERKAATMKYANSILASALALLLAGAVASAKSSDAIPSIAIVTHAQYAHVGNSGNSELTVGSTIFTSDFVSTEDGGSLGLRIGAATLDLLAGSAVHIYRAPYGAVVELLRGSVIYTIPGGKENIVIVASDIRATPEESMNDIGRVTMDDPCNITVASQRGQVNVDAGTEQHVIEEGKAYRVHALNSLEYRKYLSPDANNYHDYHEHRPCAAADIPNTKGPVMPGHSRFLLLAIGGAGAAVGLTVWKVYESPDKP